MIATLLEVNYPNIGGIQPESTTFGLPEYVKYVFSFSLGIAGLVIFIVLIYAGFLYLSSRGNVSMHADAKSRINAALLGLGVLLGSYLILNTINPQLTFLQLPPLEFLSKPQLSQPLYLEKDTLAYAEIPIGGLIAGVFSQKRLEKIDGISKNVKEASDDVLSKSQELVSLTSQCACSLAQPNCGGGSNECGGGFCTGEPCAPRSEIDQKRSEIQAMLSGSDDTLEDLQGKLETDISDLQKVYEDLNKAEEEIKNCAFRASKSGRPQVLLGYSDFWEYVDMLGEEQKIKGTEADHPFDYIPSDNAYYGANFYCVELLDQVSLAELDVSDVSATEVSVPGLPTKKEPACGAEIPIGQVVDNAENLANKILTELKNISSNALKEIGNAQGLADAADPGSCDVGSCQTECSWIEQQCWQSAPCDDSTPPPGNAPRGNWWDDFFFLLKPIYAQEGEDCGKYVDCSYCDIQPCSGSVCPGDPGHIAQISGYFLGVQTNASEISASRQELKNIIEEKDVEDEFKISELFGDLNDSQKTIRACYNSKTARQKAAGGQKVLWKELNSCSAVKQSAGRDTPFYGDDGQTLEDCYGQTFEKTDLMDNFFCCQSELF